VAKKERNDERVMQEVLFKWQPSEGGGGGGDIEDGYYEGGVRLEDEPDGYWEDGVRAQIPDGYYEEGVALAGEPDGYWVNGTRIASDLIDGFYLLKEGNINLITYLFTATDENYPYIDQLNEVPYTAGTFGGFYNIGALE
jgi:hypothetical protein